MARTAFYGRRSSLGEDTLNFSLDNQQQEYDKWVAAHGHESVKTYRDPGGKSTTLLRPVLQQAFAAARRGEFDLLVVWKYDRFSRVNAEQAQALYLLKAYGVEVVATSEPVMPGPLGDLTRALYGITSEIEHGRIVDRFIKGRRVRTQSGSLPGAPHPLYGYRHMDIGDGTGRGQKKARYVPDLESIDPDPNHAPARVVMRIYELARSGFSTVRIAKALEGDHVPTPAQVLTARGQLPRGRSSSALWRTSTISRILSNPAYKGVYQAWARTVDVVEERGPNGDLVQVQRTIKRADDDEQVVVIPDACVPLVSAEVWDAARVGLERNRQQSTRNAREPEVGLLRYGFGKCGYCGRTLQVHPYNGGTGGKRHGYRYFCSSSTQSKKEDRACPAGQFSWFTDEVDAIVWGWIEAQFKRPELLRAKYEEWRALKREGLAMEQDRLRILEKLIRQAEVRKRNYMRLAGEADDEPMSREYDGQAKQAAKEEAEFISERVKLERVIGEDAGLTATIEGLATAAERVAKNLARADYRTKRTLLWDFKVEVDLRRKTDPEPMRIRWTLAPEGEVVLQSSGTLQSNRDRELPTFTYGWSEIRRALSAPVAV